VFFYPNGSKQAEGKAENGFRTGLWTLFDEKGNKTGTAMFKGGNFHGEVVEFYPSGKVRKVEQYAEGLREGTAKEFSEDGRVVKQVEWRNNREVAAAK
jgi:antitoxin component YwqK of YwqJK toxin-antitoxin module